MLLMNHSTSSFNVEEFIKKRKRLSGNACSSKSVVDKTITRGRVKGSVKVHLASCLRYKAAEYDLFGILIFARHYICVSFSIVIFMIVKYVCRLSELP